MDYSIDEAISHLWRDREPKRRLAAAQRLGALREVRTVSALASALSDSEPQVRRAAASALAQIGDETALVALRAAVTDRQCYVRRVAAVWGLRQYRGEGAREALLDALTDPHRGVRTAVVVALGQISETANTAFLCNALGDPDSDVRIAAARALLSGADPTAAKSLCLALSDPVDEVRALVSDALGLCGCRSARSSLRRRLSVEKSPDVLNSIRQSINRLDSGTPHQLALPANASSGLATRTDETRPAIKRSRPKRRNRDQLALW